MLTRISRLFYGWRMIAVGSALRVLGGGLYYYGFSVFFLPLSQDLGLNRAAPSLNLFSLGFSVITVFGLLMLAAIARSLPEHYLRMTTRVLDLLQQLMRNASHG